MNKLKPIYLFVYLSYLFVWSLYAIYQPFYTWDMIPYVALTLSVEQTDQKMVHTMTYESIKQSIPAQAYANNTATPYQKEMEQNEVYFHQQLPFYQIRPLYIGLNYLVYKTGINIVTAIIVVSVLSSLLMSIIILRWLLEHLKTFYAYLFAILIIQSTGVVQIAQVFTPDALSAALLLFSLYVFSKRQIYFASLLLVLAIFARTDNIILVLMVFTYLTLFASKEYRLKWKPYILLVLVSTVSYLAINHLANNYGWATIFHHTLIAPIHNPSDYHPMITWADYFPILLKNAMEAFFRMNSLLFFGFCSFVTISVVRLNSQNQIYSHLTILVLLAIIVHFLLFPVLWQRFFIAHYSIICILMVITIFQSRFPKTVTKRESG